MCLAIVIYFYYPDLFFGEIASEMKIWDHVISCFLRIRRCNISQSQQSNSIHYTIIQLDHVDTIILIR